MRCPLEHCRRLVLVTFPRNRNCRKAMNEFARELPVPLKMSTEVCALSCNGSSRRDCVLNRAGARLTREMMRSGDYLREHRPPLRMLLVHLMFRRFVETSP